MIDIRLTTNRLFIRPFVQSDITEAYLQWLNDPKVTRFSNQRFLRHDLNSSGDYLSSFHTSSNSFLILLERLSMYPIGTATIYRKPEHGTADLGIMIGDRSSWGKGFGLEAWITSVYRNHRPGNIIRCLAR